MTSLWNHARNCASHCRLAIAIHFIPYRRNGNIIFSFLFCTRAECVVRAKWPFTDSTDKILFLSILSIVASVDHQLFAVFFPVMRLALVFELMERYYIVSCNNNHNEPQSVLSVSFRNSCNVTKSSFHSVQNYGKRDGLTSIPKTETKTKIIKRRNERKKWKWIFTSWDDGDRALVLSHSEWNRINELNGWNGSYAIVSRDYVGKIELHKLLLLFLFCFICVFFSSFIRSMRRRWRHKTYSIPCGTNSESQWKRGRKPTQLKGLCIWMPFRFAYIPFWLFGFNCRWVLSTAAALLTACCLINIIIVIMAGSVEEGESSHRAIRLDEYSYYYCFVWQKSSKYRRWTIGTVAATRWDVVDWDASRKLRHDVCSAAFSTPIFSHAYRSRNRLTIFWWNPSDETCQLTRAIDSRVNSFVRAALPIRCIQSKSFPASVKQFTQFSRLAHEFRQSISNFLPLPIVLDVPPNSSHSKKFEIKKLASIGRSEWWAEHRMNWGLTLVKRRNGFFCPLTLTCRACVSQWKLRAVTVTMWRASAHAPSHEQPIIFLLFFRFHFHLDANSVDAATQHHQRNGRKSISESEIVRR